jgi:biotin operon repressor
MEKLAQLPTFKDRQNIVLNGFDPVSSGGFTQLPNFIINDNKLSSNAKIVYAKLLSYAWHNDRVFPGQERMAEELGMSRPTINKAVRELEGEGYLDIQRRGQGLTNVYTLYHTVKNRG